MKNSNEQNKIKYIDSIYNKFTCYLFKSMIDNNILKKFEIKDKKKIVINNKIQKLLNQYNNNNNYVQHKPAINKN